ncbi:glycosyl hydrolase, partial [Streptomyces parvus]
VMGMPTYGQGWTGVTGGGKGLGQPAAGMRTTAAAAAAAAAASGRTVARTPARGDFRGEA